MFGKFNANGIIQAVISRCEQPRFSQGKNLSPVPPLPISKWDEKGLHAFKTPRIFSSVEYEGVLTSVVN